MPQQSPETAHKINGSCLCGGVAYEVIDAFDKLFFCSCDQCRQITGSAFASNLFVNKDGFMWLKGSDDIVNYQMPGRDISKAFCRVCGSGVPWTSGDGLKMIVPAGTLSQPAKVAERVRIFTSEQPTWAAELEKVTAHAKFPK